MKIIRPVLLSVFFAGAWLSLQGCALLVAPMTAAVIGGAQIAIKGAELQKRSERRTRRRLSMRLLKKHGISPSRSCSISISRFTEAKGRHSGTAA